MESRYFDSAGVRVHYVDEGAGDPIVLVHGFAADLEANWVLSGWFDTLRPIRRVIALDCRGHGKSGKPHDSDAYATSAMSDDVLRLMDHLQIERADLFGYSMGGAISIRAMVAHPRRFRTVTLGGVGNLAAGRRGRPGIAAALLADDPSAITDPVGKGFRVFAERRGNDLAALAAMQQAPRTNVDAAALAGTALPVLIVVGEDDAIVGQTDRLAAAIPGARLLTIPGKDHLTVVPDQRFKDAVVSFLQEPR